MKSTSPIKHAGYTNPAKQAAFDDLPDIDNPQKSELSFFEMLHIWASLDSEMAGLECGSHTSNKKHAALSSYDKKFQAEFGVTAIQAFNELPEPHKKFMQEFPHGR